LRYNQRKKEPIYEQIANYIKQSIIDQRYKENQPLPSLRSLADYLGVNIHTVQKAYNQLEHQGYIYTLKGQGKYIDKCDKANKNIRVEVLKEEILKLFTEILYLGTKSEELSSLVYFSNKIYGKYSKDI
jgi:GntR family transcriptional regulator